MNKISFKEKCDNAARLIDEAGLAAFRALDTADFIPKLAAVISCFKREYAAYLYAAAGIDPFDPAIGEADYKRQDELDRITTCFSVGCEMLDADFIRRFKPEKAKAKYGFFSFLTFNIDQKADSIISREKIDSFRVGMVGMSRDDKRLLSAALKALESVATVTDEKLVEVAKLLGASPEKLRLLWQDNCKSTVYSLDAVTEDDDGTESSLYDTVAAVDNLVEAKSSDEEIVRYLNILEALLTYKRPDGMKKSDAPLYELSRIQKERYPIVFTNKLILDWVDELCKRDPDCENRNDVFSRSFEALALADRKRKFSGYKAVSAAVFDYYLELRREITLKELASILKIESTSLSEVFTSVNEKLKIFVKENR